MKKPWDHERLHHKTFTRVIIKKKDIGDHVPGPEILPLGIFTLFS